MLYDKQHYHWSDELRVEFSCLDTFIFQFILAYVEDFALKQIKTIQIYVMVT